MLDAFSQLRLRDLDEEDLRDACSDGDDQEQGTVRWCGKRVSEAKCRMLEVVSGGRANEGEEDGVQCLELHEDGMG